jgi:DNA segregation ATPase FtsK/SpoIIIE, S-DNA-T family
MSTEKKNKFRSVPAGDSVAEMEKPENDIQDVPVRKRPERRKKHIPEDVPQKEEKPEAAPVPAPTATGRWKMVADRFLAFYRDERARKVAGLSLVLMSAYLCISLVSYFFTHEVDQDKVTGPLGDLFDRSVKVDNWLGKAGALVSHFFMYRAFGAASFALVPVLFIYGMRKLVSRPLVNMYAFNARMLFLAVWSSLALSLIFSESMYFMGGGFGYFVNELIANYVGQTGLVALLAFAMLCALVIAFNISFSLPERVKEPEAVPEPVVAAPPVFTHVTSTPQEEVPLTEAEEEALLDFGVRTVAEEKKETIQFDVVAPPVTPVVEEVPVKETVAEVKGEPELEIAQTVEEPVIAEEENKAAVLVEQFGEYDPTLDLGSYQFPHFDLLNDYGSIHSKVNQEELIANKNRILGTLKNYGIEIDKITATVGPTVTLYEIVPAAGVRISKIKNLEDDIALSLAALGIRIIAPIPGKGTIGIEVPNQTPEMVPMRNILASEKFNNSQFELPIALGKTISNEIFIADLAKMPHLLMAGATGQGKSVGLNAVLVSLLYKKHPSQVKFVLVDPKKVELTLFNKIERHFLAKLPNAEDAIITDNTKVIHTLNSLCIEMDNRYALLQDAQVRNIKEYNAKFVQRKLNPNDGHKFLPYIVLVVDEFADLIMTAGKEVETPIARLAQLARAIGIHLIIATQRPSVNIITGTIKANFPARIAFRVTSKIDSRTILDSGGADQLIGRGDMLLSTGNDLIRIQCAFVDTPEVEKITEFIGGQRAYPSAFMLPEYVGEEGDGGKEDVDLSERDKMFDEAARLIVQFQQGSASFLQRKLKLGYNRAGRIVDQMEAAGIIGPFEGSKAREVLIRDMAQLDEILQKLKGKD